MRYLQGANVYTIAPKCIYICHSLFCQLNCATKIESNHLHDLYLRDFMYIHISIMQKIFEFFCIKEDS